jgi:hypothetical protein
MNRKAEVIWEIFIYWKYASLLLLYLETYYFPLCALFSLFLSFIYEIYFVFLLLTFSVIPIDTIIDKENESYHLHETIQNVVTILAGLINEPAV